MSTLLTSAKSKTTAIIVLIVLIGSAVYMIDASRNTKDSGKQTPSQRMDLDSTDGPFQRERWETGSRARSIDSLKQGDGSVAEHNINAVPDNDPGRIDPIQFQTAASFLEHIAMKRDIEPSQMSTEILSWELYCSRSRISESDNRLPTYDSERYRRIMDKFESYCAGIGGAAEFARTNPRAEDVISLFEGPPPKSVFDELDKMGQNAALEIVMRELEAALDHFSIPRAQVVIGELVTNNIYPQVEERGINFWVNLYHLSFQTAFTLVCERLGGCIGVDHPFIVAYCLESTASAHKFCNLPSSMSQAIYQTLTPVEHQQYLALLNWINTELAKRRTSTRR